MTAVRGYFITGTDTNVGKTFVASALARRAASRGHRVFAFKPIETGCLAGRDGVLVGADQAILVEAAGGWQAGQLAGLYQFQLPAAPLVAAEAVGAAVDLDGIVGVARRGMEESGVTFAVIEGAGGLRVPLTGDADMASLALKLALPAIVVARAGLGTINHSLLTLEALGQERVPVAALVVSRRPDDDLTAAESNCEQIGRRWPGLVILLEHDASVLDRLIP